VPSQRRHPEQLQSHKLKYEAQESSEVRGPFEKSAYPLQSLLGPLKARHLHITTAVGAHLKAK